MINSFFIVYSFLYDNDDTDNSWNCYLFSFLADNMDQHSLCHHTSIYDVQCLYPDINTIIRLFWILQFSLTSSKMFLELWKSWYEYDPFLHTWIPCHSIGHLLSVFWSALILCYNYYPSHKDLFVHEHDSWQQSLTHVKRCLEVIWNTYDIVLAKQ